MTWKGGLFVGLLRGVLVGIVLALAELTLAPRFLGAFIAPSWDVRIGVLALLPICTGIVGALAGLLGTFAPLLAMGLAFAIGANAAEGGAARQLPLAAFWKYAVLILCTLGLYGLRRLGRGRRQLLFLALGVLVYLVAAFSYRGSYPLLRALASAASAGFLFASSESLSARLLGARRWLLPLLLILLLAARPWRAPKDQDAIDWAERGGTAVAALATEARRLFVRAPAAPELIAPERSVYAGSDLQAKARARLRERVDLRGILFVTIDAWRGDLERAAPDGEVLTPFLDEQAAQGQRFLRAYSSAVSSSMSLVSTFSGLWPTRALSLDGGANAAPFAAARLQDAGIATRAVFPSAIHTVTQAGFERRDLGFRDAREHPQMALGEAELFAALRPAPTDQRWFSWAHLMLPHAPYDEADAKYRRGDGDWEGYLAELRQVDAEMRRLVQRFESEGLMKDAIVVVASDHGEEFMEHGHRHHGTHLFEESIRVPLLAWGPGVEPGGLQSGVVSCADLAPTFEDLFGLELEDVDRDGRSLLPLLVGLDDPDRSGVAVSECPPLDVPLLPVLAAIIRSEEKLIVDRRLQRFYLFDLVDDPGERRNLASERTERRDRLRGELAGQLAREAGLPLNSDDSRLLELINATESLAPPAFVGLMLQQSQLPSDLLALVFAYIAGSLSPKQAEDLIQVNGTADAVGLQDAALLRASLPAASARTLALCEAALGADSEWGSRFAALQIARRFRLDSPLIRAASRSETKPGSLLGEAWDARRLGYRAELGLLEDAGAGRLAELMVHPHRWIRRLAPRGLPVVARSRRPCRPSSAG